MRAMILAAGRGNRLRPLTDNIPKPLIPVQGKSLIARHLENLAKAGIVEVVINLGHLGHQIADSLGTGSQFGVRIQYSLEDPVLETGGGIYKALPLLGSEPFVALAADLITDYPFEALKQVIPNLKLAHLVLVNNPLYHSKGDYGFQEDNFISDSVEPRFNFAGIGVYRPELFAECPRGAFRLPELFKREFGQKTITGEHFSGAWYNIGTLEELQKAEALFDKTKDFFSENSSHDSSSSENSSFGNPL